MTSMKRFLALTGFAALAVGASPLCAQLMQPPPTPPQVPAGVTPFIGDSHGRRAQNTDVESSRVPTPPPPPAESGPAQLASGAAPADTVSVDAIVAALYASVSHGPEYEPNWNRLRGLFLPKAIVVPPRRSDAQALSVLDVDAFEQRIRTYIAGRRERGEPLGFTEREIARRESRFGNVSQVFSTYETVRAPGDPSPFARGIHSIQLVYDGRRWWIAALVWDNEREDNPIPRNQ
ncbi:MAG TPA: hypothetical protein VMT25_06920 [Thermoanaerobaculia bacterium]|nr:hypothetical protein [Thermoanaerobaculia bacterium]